MNAPLRTAPTGLLALALAAPVPLLAGCDKETESPGSISVSTEALSFGEVAVDDEAVLTFTLDNSGDSEVEILSVSLIEGESTVWNVERDEGDALGGGDSIEVRVTFGPTDVEDFDGRLQIRSTDDANANLYVTVDGTGTPSETDYDGDGYAAADGDCDEDNADVNPGADEICDGIDNDCDGSVPSNEADEDYDGYRLCDGDCNDDPETGPLVYPGADEICDDQDSDCDGVSADHEDDDGDGYTICDGDCDDDAPTAHPGEVEACDGLDNDCSGQADDIDVDGDGHSPCDPAPDCDDDDFDAHPVAVSPEGSSEGAGTALDPLDSIEAALAQLDDVCRTLYLLPGEYTVSETWTAGSLTIAGGGEDEDEVILRPPEGEPEDNLRVFTVTGGELTLKNLTVTGATTATDGGAVLVDDASLTVSGVTFADNQSGADGGAIRVNAGELIVSRSTFSDNVAIDDGGAIYASSSTMVCTNNDYRTNSGVRGGAVVAETTDLTVSGALFRQNTASEEGGGLAVLGVTALSIEGSEFLLNSAGNRGGGLTLVDVSDADGLVANNLIQDNAAGSVGGGLALYGSATVLTVANNTLFGNAAPDEGAGMWVSADDASGLTVWSNLVVWSQGASGLYAEPGAGGDYAWNLGYATSNKNSDFVGDAIEGDDFNGTENLVANPQFETYSDNGNPDDDVLNLQGSSPAVDSGPPGPSWNDPDGSRNDRGVTGGPGA